MTKSPRRSRRDALRLIAVSSAAAVAGCGAPESRDGGDGTEPEDEEDAETPTEDEGTGEGDNETEQGDDGGEDGGDGDEGGNGEDGGAEDEEPSGDNETEEGEAGGEAEDSGDEGEAGNGEDGGAEDGADGEWTEVDEVVLNGFTAGWEGVEPAVIEGEENPTLVLTEGAEYDLVWDNADGQPHNIEIHDGDGEIVGEYSTEIIEEEGETQTLTIEASAEMAEYVCVVHPTTMVGSIEIAGN